MTKARRVRIKVTGNTYPHKDEIKTLGGKWDPKEKCWMIERVDDYHNLTLPLRALQSKGVEVEYL